MALNYAEQWSPELLEILIQGTLTSPFVTSNVRWLDAKTFHFTQMSTSGYKNHSREGGWNKGTYTQTDVPYTLTHAMKYPCLVPKRLCKTDITVSIAREDVSKYGEPLEPVTYTGRCNYQDKAKTIFTEEKKLVQITGSALFPGDICPELPTISGGTAIIFGVQRQIQEARKNRNPDGTVNYTEVMLL